MAGARGESMGKAFHPRWFIHPTDGDREPQAPLTTESANIVYGDNIIFFSSYLVKEKSQIMYSLA